MKKLLAFVTALFTGIFATGLAMAAEGAAAGADSKGAAIAIAAGIAVAIAAFGAAFGQGRVGAAAMESIGRNPNAAERLFLPLVLTLALLEALALYGFVIAIILSGKILLTSQFSVKKDGRKSSRPFLSSWQLDFVEMHLSVAE